MSEKRGKEAKVEGEEPPRKKPDDGDDGWTSSSGHDLSLTLIDLVRPWAGW